MLSMALLHSNPAYMMQAVEQSAALAGCFKTKRSGCNIWNLQRSPAVSTVELYIAFSGSALYLADLGCGSSQAHILNWTYI